MRRQVFLGGAAGNTTWRQDIAIPAFQSAGISFYDPQLPLGAWSEANEAAEMQAKDEADILLFVLNGETRGVATVGEAAYYLGLGRQLALVVDDIPPAASLYGRPLPPEEIDDLNRGRIFLRTMAKTHRVPVHATIEDAVQYAITRLQAREDIRSILDDIHYPGCAFTVEPFAGAWLLQIHSTANNFCGRKWHLEPTATRAEIVRTALKAALTWQEHETREQFTYRGKPVFGPHFEL
jgi:hypothetical protein